MEKTELTPEKSNADSKNVTINSHSIFEWLINLFNPPPLTSMTFTQKVGRVILLSSTLVIGSILLAMLAALGLFLMEKGRELGSTPKFYQGLGIVLLGISVNSACVMILFQIKKADSKLLPPKA